MGEELGRSKILQSKMQNEQKIKNGMKTKLILSIGILAILSSCQDRTAAITPTNTQVNHNSTNNTPDTQTRSAPTIISESVNDPLALKLKKYIVEQYMTEADLRTIDEKDRIFQLYEIDLNNDGKKEVFVNFVTPYFCGSGGCALLLLDADMKLISKFSVTRTPLYAEKAVVNGYRKLLTKSEGQWKELNFDGKKYPSNPTLLKKSTYEKPSSDAEIIFDDKYLKAKNYTF